MSVVPATEEVAFHARRTLNPRFLELIILPTERCNFRCLYCYEDFSVGKMKPQVVRSIKRLVDERLRDLSTFKISWFGGEPLVAADVVLDLTEYASRECKKAGVRFIGDMTTNGYRIDSELFAKLVELGITSYQITLDGLADQHDKTRRLANGGGTFDRIWSNLLKCKKTELDFQITIRLHITRQNIDHIEAIHAEVRREFGDDQRFQIFIKAIENLGGPATVASTVPDKKRVSELQRRYDALKAHSITLDDSYICYAARPNSFVIRADGRVAKCTVAFNSDSNHIGRIKDNGGMELNIDKLRLWFSGYNSLNKAELLCPASALHLW